MFCNIICDNNILWHQTPSFLKVVQFSSALASRPVIFNQTQKTVRINVVPERFLRNSIRNARNTYRTSILNSMNVSNWEARTKKEE